MATSGEQLRPARILLVAPDGDLERLHVVLRSQGYIVEVARDGAAVDERLERSPAIEVVLIDGIEDRERARALAAAHERSVWCVYLDSPGGRTRLRHDERAQFVAALPADASDAQIARTLLAVIAARRARAASE